MGPVAVVVLLGVATGLFGLAGLGLGVAVILIGMALWMAGETLLEIYREEQRW